MGLLKKIAVLVPIMAVGFAMLGFRKKRKPNDPLTDYWFI
jgi:hypothetical protein